jgi:hypothetical protein
MKPASLGSNLFYYTMLFLYVTGTGKEKGEAALTLLPRDLPAQ